MGTTCDNITLPEWNCSLRKYLPLQEQIPIFNPVALGQNYRVLAILCAIGLRIISHSKGRLNETTALLPLKEYKLTLTLKAPNKNCSRRHFNFLFLSFKENKA